MKEISHVDGIKYKTSHCGSVSSSKNRDAVTESASVKKSSKGLPERLTSKEKHGMNQIVPHNSVADEAKKYQKNVPKYPGPVRRASPEYYMTIGEYFGKNFLKTESEIKHVAKNYTKNLIKKEFISKNSLQLVSGNKWTVIGTNIEKSDQVTKNTSTKTVPAELKQKLVNVSDNQHRSKSLKCIKRRKSDHSDLFSKPHKRRRYSYGGEGSAVFGISAEKGSKIVGNEKKIKKNEDKILEIPEPVATEQAAAYGLAIQNATKTKPIGRTIDKETLFGKEREVCSETECVTIQGLSAESATKSKPEGSELVKMKKNEEKILKEDTLLCKPEQQPAAEVVSTEKAKKMKRGRSEMVVNRNNEKNKDKKTKYAQCFETEVSAAGKVMFIQKMTKVKLEGSEVAKIRKTDEKVAKKERPHHFKGEEQAVAQGVPPQKTSNIKPGGNGMVNIRKDKEEMLVKEDRHSSIVDVGVLIKEACNKTAISKPKCGASEMVKARKSHTEVLRKERQHHSFKSYCEKNKDGMSLQKKQNRVNAVKDITHTSPSHAFKSGLKCSRHKKKEKMMLELFGEDPDESSREYSDSLDGVGCKVLQESDTSAVSANVSDNVEASVAFVTTLKQNHKGEDNRSRDCQLNTFSHKSDSETKSLIKGMEGENDHQKILGFGVGQLVPLSHESEVQNAGSQNVTRLIDCVDQSNHSENIVSGSIKDREIVLTVQHNIEDQSNFSSHENDLDNAAIRTVVECADTLGENGHQKDNKRGGCQESELLVTCSSEAGIVTETVVQNNELKLDGFRCKETNESEAHRTSMIKEIKNREFHLVINMGSIDTLFPSPQNDQCGTTIKLSSVKCNETEGTSDVSDGHYTNMKGVASAKKCTENSEVSLDTGESVEENVTISTSDNAEVSTLYSETSASAEKHFQNVSDKVYAKQNQRDNERHAVQTSARSEPPQDLVLPSKESVGDILSQSQNVSLSATLTKQSEVELTESHAETSSSQTLYDERLKENNVEKGKTIDTTMSLISVNYSVAEGTNIVTDGHCTNMKGVASAEKCTGNSEVSLDTGESVEENVNVSISGTTEVSTLCRETSASTEKHFQNVSDKVCAKQNRTDSEHHTVQKSARSEPPQDLVLPSKESVQDSLSQLQNVSLSATLTKQSEVELTEIHAETSTQTLHYERCKEINVKVEKTTDRVTADGEDIQREYDASGRKIPTESDCVLNVDCSKESHNLQQSTVNSNQSHSYSTLQTNISNSGEYSALDTCGPSVTSEMLPEEQLGGHSLITDPSQPESVLLNSRNTNGVVPHVSDAPVCQPRIRVRDPASLGITQSESSYFEVMDKKLSHLTELTYILMQDMIRIVQRCKAISPLTGTLRDVEAALVKAEYTNPHLTRKADVCLNLYESVKRSFPNQIEEFLVKRLNGLNPSRIYTSEELKRCLNYCKLICDLKKSSVPNPQQHQQQPVVAPIVNNVAWNTNNEVLSLPQAGEQIPNSGADINSRHQTSGSVQNISSVPVIQYTNGRKEIVTHTSDYRTNVPPPYDMPTREVGTTYSARHSQFGNINQQFTNYSPVQAQNSSSQRFQTYPISTPHMSVSATDIPIPLAQGQVYNGPPKNRTVPSMLQHTWGAQNTAQCAVQNRNVYHGSNRGGVGFTGGVPVSGSSYSQSNSVTHRYPPNQQGAPSYNTSSSMYPQSQQSTLLHHSSNDAVWNTSSLRAVNVPNQGNQQTVFSHIWSKNAVLDKSAPNTSSQPCHRNEPIQQGISSQTVSSVLPNSSSQPYLSNGIHQGTPSHCASNTSRNISAAVSSSKSYPQNEITQQGTCSQTIKNTAPNTSTVNSSSQLYSNTVLQSTFSYYLNNVALKNTPHWSSKGYLPNQAICSGMLPRHLGNPSEDNLLRGLLGVPTAGSGYVQQARNNLYPSSSHGGLPSNYTHLTQMRLQALQQLSAQEYHAPASQENTGSYSRGLFPQQSQALSVAPGPEQRLHGTPQRVIQRRSSGRRNANSKASNKNSSSGGSTQNVPARNGFFDKGNNWNGSLGNGTARNSLHDKGNGQNESLANSTACNSVSYRNTWSGQESNSFSDRGNSQSGYLANSMANNSISDRGNNQSISVTNTTASNSFSDRGNSQSGYLTDSTASKNLSCRRNNRSDFLLNTRASNSFSDRRNNWSVPPPLIEIPTSVGFQTRLNGVHKQLTSTESHSVNGRKAFSGVHTASEATALGDSQMEINNSHITSLQNSQTFHGDKQSSLCRNQQRQISNKVTADEPEVSNGTLVMAQASNKVTTCEREVSNSTLVTAQASNKVTTCEREVSNRTLVTAQASNKVTADEPEVSNSTLVMAQASNKVTADEPEVSNSTLVTAQASNKVTADEPEVSNSTLTMVQSSGSQSHVPAVFKQTAGMLLPAASPSLQSCVFQPFGAHHRMHSGTESELPEKTVSDPHNTHSTLSTETQQNASDKVTLRTWQGTSSNNKSRNQPDRGEVVGSRSDKVEIESEGLITEVDGSENVQRVAGTGGKQNKCDTSNRMLEKYSTCHNNLPDQEMELSAVMAGEEGNRTAVETHKQAEQSDVTILRVIKYVPMPTSESSQTTSLNKISTDTATEARESDTDVKVVSSVLLAFYSLRNVGNCEKYSQSPL
jgi:hypothetical protein